MSPTDFQQRLAATTNQLHKSDSVLAQVIERAGACKLEPHTDYFEALADAILGQQLSTKVARVIRDRFAALGEAGYPTPAEVAEFSDEALRGIGLSGAKVKYVRDLAAHVLDGRLDLAHLSELVNEEIITELTDVNGIGEWTAQMFLIFCLARLDVLPTGDLGVRKGMMALYELPELPDVVAMERIAERKGWTGAESVAAWYVWRSLELAV
jgi:DNA-3-methyladenine glycosylase II